MVLACQNGKTVLGQVGLLLIECGKLEMVLTERQRLWGLSLGLGLLLVPGRRAQLLAHVEVGVPQSLGSSDMLSMSN